MSTDLIRTGQASLATIADLIAHAETLDSITEIRARIEAAKAWAKVHGQIKSVRLDLLRAEVAALVRIVELGGLDLLPKRERRAAQWLANKSAEDRERLLSESGSATTAVGMCQSIWREAEVAQHRAAMRRAGVEFAQTPNPAAYDEPAIRAAARRQATNLAAAMQNAIEEYGGWKVGFSIDEMADAVVAEAAVPSDIADDPEFLRGVREVCRGIVMKAPPLSIDGTLIPRFVTCTAPGGTWVRIPTQNALVRQLDEMVALRTEQLEQDRAALARLMRFADQIKAQPGVSPDEPIGDVIARTVVSPERSAAA